MTSIGTFNSASYSGTEPYVVQRIVNLNAAPAISKTTPAQTSLLNSVSTAKVAFSKLLSSAAALPGSYSLGGDATGLSISGASFTGVDRVENVSTVTLSGTPSAGGSLVITATSAIKDTAGTSISTSANKVNYTLDITPPDIGLSQSPTGLTKNDVTVTVNATDASGVTLKKYASGSQAISFFATGGTVLTGTTFTVSANGTYTVYAKDAAGNEAVNTITVSNIDKTAPDAYTTGSVTPRGGTETAGYWNASNTSVDVVVPVANDSSLTGGTIQVTVQMESGGGFKNLGSAVSIAVSDLGTNKTLSFTAAQLEAVAGFGEGQIVDFASQMSDAAANVTTGGISASKLTVDQLAPAINNGTISASNNTVTLTFSEGVFSSVGGALDPASFNLTFNKNGGTADSASITGVTHALGTNSAVLDISVDGTPDGKETIVIGPKDSASIYDAAGNPALSSSTRTFALKDVTPPSIALSHSPTTPTTSDVTITAVITDASGIAAQKYAPGIQNNTFFETGGGTDFTGSFTVSANGDYTVYAQDNAGVSNVQTIAISNIDKDAPDAFTTGTVVPRGGTVVFAFWNSTNQFLDITVPIANDASLSGGTVKAQVKFGAGSWVSLVDSFAIGAGDLGTNKTVSFTKARLEGLSGFAEGIDFTAAAILSDNANNSTTGGQSASVIYVDTTPPVITGGTLYNNNTQVSVTFSVPVSGPGGAAIDADLFVLNFAKGSGTATGASVLSVSYEGASNTAVLEVSVAGTPNGKETISVSPKSGTSIYDAAGNAMPGSASTPALSVIDKTPPVVNSFTSSTPFPTTGSVAYHISAGDAMGITGWILTETSTPPLASAAGWTDVSSAVSFEHDGSYPPQVSGCHNLYVWVKDAAGNVSAISNKSYLTYLSQKNPWQGDLIRDAFNDDGNVPVNNGCLWVSPDIIVRESVSANPAADFANYGADYCVPGNLKKGKTYYIYLRYKNLGTVPTTAGQVQGYLYFSDANLFGSPNIWINNSIKVMGSTEINNPLPATNAGVVSFSPPFQWTPDVTGHYCFIGVVSSERYTWDPVNPLKFQNGIEFGMMMQNSPHLCWRNYTIEQTTGFKNVYTRGDRLHNQWREPLPVMVGVTVRNVPVGTQVQIQNKDLGIDVKHVMTKPEEVIYTPGAVLKGGADTQVTTTVTLPKENRFQNGTQIETAAYMGVKSKNVAKTCATENFGKAANLASVRSAVKLTDKIGTGTTKADANGPVGFVRMGACTTLFDDPAVKAVPVLATTPVPVAMTDKPAAPVAPKTPMVKMGAFKALFTKKKPDAKKKPAVAKKASVKKPAPKKVAPKKTVKKAAGKKIPVVKKIGTAPVKKKVTKKSVAKKSPVGTHSRASVSKKGSASVKSGASAKGKKTKAIKGKKK